jgi:predicted  nucleic acid-binding Zn-ribbon protein
MMATLGQKLYRLQLLDTELTEHRSRLRETQALLGETREVREARTAQEKAATELTQQRARLKDLEFELQGLNAKIMAAAGRLYGGEVTNPKELHGLQQDHDYLQRSRHKQEDDVLEAMTLLEKCEKEAAAASAHRTDVEGHWRTEQAKHSKQVEQLQAKVAALTKDRATMIAPLDASTRALYEELMKKKGGRAVALLVGQTCGGCRVTLPSGKVQQVRRGQQLSTCTNCERILVVQD